MPQVTVKVFRDHRGGVPLVEWLDALSERQPDAHAKCIHAILELERLGHEARRPLADALRDGIRELRIRHLRVQYRILYFFDGKCVVVLSHGITKEGSVPNQEIERAKTNMELVKESPEDHIALWESL